MSIVHISCTVYVNAAVVLGIGSTGSHLRHQLCHHGLSVSFDTKCGFEGVGQPMCLPPHCPIEKSDKILFYIGLFCLLEGEGFVYSHLRRHAPEMTGPPQSK